MRPRIAQRADHLEELDDARGPAMGEDQREGVGLFGLDVEEVDGLTVDLGEKLRVGVEPRLPGAPVEPVQPLLGQFLDEGDRLAAAPIGGRGMRPARHGQAFLQIGDLIVGHLNLERGNGHFVCSGCMGNQGAERRDNCRRSRGLQEAPAIQIGHCRLLFHAGPPWPGV
jgi:hypothetical protein